VHRLGVARTLSTVNEAPRSKLRGITEHRFEDFSETEMNPVASYGEYSSSKPLAQNYNGASYSKRNHVELLRKDSPTPLLSSGFPIGI
jgi:hypothetical protein